MGNRADGQMTMRWVATVDKQGRERMEMRWQKPRRRTRDEMRERAA